MEGGQGHGGTGKRHGACPPPHAQPSAVRSFVAGKSILLTGGTGFIGKVLIEKLLRCCPEVRTIFVLIRRCRKTGKTGNERLSEILASRCFDRLRAMWPDFSQRCRAVEGDVQNPAFGIGEADLVSIREQTSIVFHCAATVKFNEHLTTALRINVDGISHLLDLCRSLRKLDVLVHVSTAYVNAPDHSNDVLQEGVTVPLFDHDAFRREVASMSHDDVTKCTPQMLARCGNWPNTYALTKHMGEALLSRTRGNLPTVIVRPSIVTCAAAQPSVGWTDTLTGPAGLVLAVAFGVLHAAPGKKDLIVDFVPVDYVINTLLGCAWYEGTRHLRTGDSQAGDSMISHSHAENVDGGIARSRRFLEDAPMVVHCGTSCDNPVPWRYMLQVMPGYYERHPSNRTIGPIFFRWAGSKHVYRLLNAMLHWTPAMVIDAKEALLGRKGDMRSKMRKIDSAIESLEYFTHHEWCFGSANHAKVMHAMPFQDREIFYMDVRNIVWDCYFEGWSHGMKVYLLGEEPSWGVKRSRL